MKVSGDIVTVLTELKIKTYDKVDLSIEDYNELLSVCRSYLRTKKNCGGDERLNRYKLLGLVNQIEFKFMKEEKEKVLKVWRKHAKKKSKRVKKAGDNTSREDSGVSSE